jgi:hypothetical protein
MADDAVARTVAGAVAAAAHKSSAGFCWSCCLIASTKPVCACRYVVARNAAEAEEKAAVQWGEGLVLVQVRYFGSQFPSAIAVMCCCCT